jgi:hypothetical protein
LKFDIGDEVVCIYDTLVPSFIGTTWVIEETLGQLYLCRSTSIYYDELYPFKQHEIAKITPLIKELL